MMNSYISHWVRASEKKVSFWKPGKKIIKIKQKRNFRHMYIVLKKSVRERD